ncbi:hypothetical protein DM860_008586 [Cuscuta australis]|uniref:Uncharacterized protein n=1 Tax=Cuscuta australis TaxID=267555 RepID=A0A328D8S9_9ASTE|nr:hypothetical protein DM860_008586 [Cuscuta australis]
MVVTTRSQAKKAEKLGVSESKFESGEINGRKTWRDWMTNWTVMHKARELWIQEIFCEKQRAENPALLRTQKLRYVARREWDSIADTEKAPFITKALDALAPGPVLAGALTMKVVRKTSKQTSESEYCLCQFQGRLLRESLYDSFRLQTNRGGQGRCKQDMGFFG